MGVLERMFVQIGVRGEDNQPCVFSGTITKNSINTNTRGYYLVSFIRHFALKMHYKNAL